MSSLVTYRADYLSNYQDHTYAHRYRSLVDRAADAEQALGLTGDDFARAVALGYFKLLAYKDEYEVARLYSRPEFREALAEQFEGNFKVRLHMAPPLLSPRDPHTQLPLKRQFGGWILPFLRMLAPLKRLRGTAFDPFGYTAERKLERRLIAEYEVSIEHLLGHLSHHNRAIATEIAALPNSIRGFGHVKQRNAEAAEQQRAALLARFNGAKAQVVNIVDPDAMRA